LSEGKLWPLACLSALFFIQNFFDLLFPGMAPALVLIGVVYFALRGGPVAGLIFGAYAGALIELYGQGSLGFYIAAWAAAGLGAGYLSRQVFPDSLVAEILIPGAASYLLCLAELFYRQLGEGGAFPWWGLVEALQPATLVSTILSSLILFSWLRKLPARRRRTRPAYR
jgi:rod shape-determining protein MreD